MSEPVTLHRTLRAANLAREAEAGAAPLADLLADLAIGLDRAAIALDVDLSEATARRFNAAAEAAGLRVRLASAQADEALIETALSLLDGAGEALEQLNDDRGAMIRAGAQAIRMARRAAPR